MRETLRDWRWTHILMAAMTLGCFSSGGGGIAGEGAGGSSAFESPAPSGASCSSLCSQIAADCGSPVSDCTDECNQDQGQSASCGESSEWSELLSCCNGADFTPYCDEDGFDPCQKGACAELRPAGAADGC